MKNVWFASLVSLFSLLNLTCKSLDRTTDLSTGVTIGPDAQVLIFFKKDKDFHIRKCPDLTWVSTPEDIDTKCPAKDDNTKILPEKYFAARLASMFFLPSLKEFRESSEFCGLSDVPCKSEQMAKQELQANLEKEIATITNFIKDFKDDAGKYTDQLKNAQVKLKELNFSKEGVQGFNDLMEKTVAMVADSKEISQYRASDPDQQLMVQMLRSLFFETPEMSKWERVPFISNTVAKYAEGSVVSEVQPVTLLDGSVLHQVFIRNGAQASTCSSELRIYDPKTAKMLRQVPMPQKELHCKLLPYFWSAGGKIMFGTADDTLLILDKENRPQAVKFAGKLRSNLLSVDENSILIINEEISKTSQRAQIVFRHFSLEDFSSKIFFSRDCPQNTCETFGVNMIRTDSGNINVYIHHRKTSNLLEQITVSPSDSKVLASRNYLLPNKYYNENYLLPRVSATQELSYFSGLDAKDYELFVLNTKDKMSSFSLNVGGSLERFSSLHALSNGLVAFAAVEATKDGKAQRNFTVADPFSKKYTRVATKDIRDRLGNSPYQNLYSVSGLNEDVILAVFQSSDSPASRIYKMQTFNH